MQSFQNGLNLKQLEHNQMQPYLYINIHLIQILTYYVHKYIKQKVNVWNLDNVPKSFINYIKS